MMGTKGNKRVLVRLIAAIIIAAIWLMVPATFESVLAAPVSNATIINISSYLNVRSKPSNQGSVVTTATLGTRVAILSQVEADESDTSGFSVWYKIQFIKNSTTYSGYVASPYVQKDAVSDEPSDEDFEAMIEGFPDSYKPYLRNLHDLHPNWIFHAENVNASWATCLYKETQDGVSLIQDTVDSAWISTAYSGVRDSPNWVNASRGIVAYYMDPRNMLNENSIFQFFDINAPDNCMPYEAIDNVLAGTFMGLPRTCRYIDATQFPYHIIFAVAGMDAAPGEEYGINPIFLATHIIQECGINGSYSSNGSSGYYNHYNIGAYSSVTNAAAGGIRLAHYGLDSTFNEHFNIPWDTPGKSIINGAKWIYENYTAKGQDTLYYMRFNVAPDRAYNVCQHQYMTAIQSCASEGQRMYNSYVKSGLIDNALNFYIPVYTDMPDKPCPIPTSANQYQDFINHIYDGLLDRDASQTETDYTTRQLANGNSAANLCLEIIYSEEFEALHSTGEDIVNVLYNTLLGRNPKGVELTQWVTKLDEGYSVEYVYTMLINSAECHSFLSSLDVLVGIHSNTDPIDSQMSNRPLIIDLYQNILDREPTGSEVRDGISAISDSSIGYPAIGGQLIKSDEFDGRGLSYESVVDVIYGALLGRNPADSESDYWVNIIASGMSYEYVYTQIVNSEECRTRLAEAGIELLPYYVNSDRIDNNMNLMPLISQLYSGVFGRNPDRNGARYWINVLITNEMSGPQMAALFFNSDEMSSKGLDNEEFIRTMYLVCLGREADEAGLEYWVNRLNSYYTRDMAIEGFVNSEEFALILDEYGVSCEAYRASDRFELNPDAAKISSFVSRLYSLALGREADESGLEFWVTNITNGTYNGYTIGQGFVMSQELENMQLTDEEYIETLYRIFLDREPDEAGLEFWIGQMENGSSRIDVYDDLAFSDEYVVICVESGILPYEGFFTLIDD